MVMRGSARELYRPIVERRGTAGKVVQQAHGGGDSGVEIWPLDVQPGIGTGLGPVQVETTSDGPDQALSLVAVHAEGEI
ncbi:MAG: hypothetical protein R3D25_01465 [Geminicoccaceae bacterium]